MKDYKKTDLVEFCFSISINTKEINPEQTETKLIKLEQDQKMFETRKLDSKSSLTKDKMDGHTSKELSNQLQTESSTYKNVKKDTKLDNIPSFTYITPKKPQKSFVCGFEGCGKRFDYKWILDRHINSHFCFKLHKCDYQGCEKAYKSRENLNLHIRNKHLGEKPYQCSYCISRFSHRNGKTYHERKVHINYLPHKCPMDECKQCFASKSALSYHLLNQHD